MSMTITNAGSLDHPITLIEKSTTRTPAGGHKEAAPQEIQVSAGKRDRHGGEGYEADQKEGTSIVNWRIWYNPNVNQADWQVRDDVTGKVYEILSIIEIGSRQMQELKTKVSDNE